MAKRGIMTIWLRQTWTSALVTYALFPTPLLPTPLLSHTPHPTPHTPLVTAQNRPAPAYIRPRVTCPSDIKILTTAMLRDLPAYMNRQSARSRPRENRTYAIFANQPELMPLPAESSEYTNPVDPNLHQVFFTVYERLYVGQQVAQFQHYHWLFLTDTPDGWQIALMFSRLGSYPSDPQQPITPPRDSSQGLTAQAIRVWLRDCAAGSVKL